MRRFVLLRDPVDLPPPARALTLVLALRCREGAVLAADDQLTRRAPRGRVARTTQVTKLLHTGGIAWG
jgi:hypothetical protein